MLKKVFLYIMACLYILAGINHFIHPDGYLKLIPPYIPFPSTANYLAGFAEILLGGLLLFKQSRSIAAWGIIAMLIAFVPAHIYMIQNAPFNTGRTMITPFIAWIRIPLQLVLIWWAWIYTNSIK